MAEKPKTQFGRRETTIAAQKTKTTKRSGHVALLLAGTVAVGGGAYALMPSENCGPNQPGMAATSSAECAPRNSSSSSGGHGSSGGSSRSSFFSGDSSSSNSGATSSDSSHVTRGGFGSFAHAFTSHFSGGG